MAAPRESIAFCNIPSETDFLSISSAYSEDTVVVSCRRKLLNVYNLSDQKSVKSWSLWHGVSLTSPVLWDSKNEIFVTVVNNQDVRLWGKDTNDFDKSKKKHSNTKIYQVMLANGFSPLILFMNGKIDFLDKIKEDHSDGILKSGEEIFWCKTLTNSSTVTVLFTVLAEKSVKMYINTYDNVKKTWRHRVEAVPCTTDSCKLLSCDCCMNSDEITVFFLWSDGQLSSVAISSEEITHKSVQQLPGALKQGSLTALNDLHIAVVGLKKDKKEGLCIYDTKFGLVKSWQPLLDKQMCKSQVCQLGDNLFIPCGTTLYLYKCMCQPSTVSSLLGSVKHTESITDKTVPEHHLWNAKKKNSGVPQPNKLENIFADLLKISLTTETYSDFQKPFHDLVTELKKNRNHHWLETSHMTCLVQKLLKDKNFLTRKEIQQLINMKCIPMSVIGQLFDCLVSRCEVMLLHSALSILPNIPERCMCSALSFFLQCEEEKLPGVFVEEQNDFGEGETEISPVSAYRAAVINKILCLPYSDVFLLECLRKLPFKDALKLLEYLCYVLKTRSSLPADNFHNEKSGTSLDQVVDWLCLVLDAHITQLVLSPDSHMCILKLKSVVNEQMNFFDGLITLEALLEQFKARSLLPQEKKMGQYCIEVLHVY